MRKSHRSYLQVLLFALATLVVTASNADDEIDPPARVGRVALVNGDVTLRNSDTDEWQPIAVNWPITSHDVLWSGAGAHAEIRLGSTILRLDSGTELEIVRLDDQRLHVWLHRGSLAVRLADRDRAREFELSTDHGAVSWMEAGRYRFDYADYTTTVTAYQGQLHFAGFGQTYAINQGQSAEIWYSGTLDSRLTGLRRDDFFNWNQSLDRREESRGSERYVSTEMTGYEDLDAYGDWRETAEYGAVWAPRLVPIGWAPYRHGRWAMIAPWGWTWIDEQPWGFAPFHYGRWAYLGRQWCWVPGSYVVRPVYAPALVAWIGQPDSLQVVIGVPGAAWLPLGPREAYYPGYHASRAYLRDVNVSHVNNIIVDGDHRSERIDYVNRRQPNAVTVVDVDVIRHGRRIDNAAIRDIDVHRLAALPARQTAPVEAPERRQFRPYAAGPDHREAPGATPPAREARLPGRPAEPDDARRPQRPPARAEAAPAALPEPPAGRPSRQSSESASVRAAETPKPALQEAGPERTRRGPVATQPKTDPASMPADSRPATPRAGNRQAPDGTSINRTERKAAAPTTVSPAKPKGDEATGRHRPEASGKPQGNPAQRPASASAATPVTEKQRDNAGHSEKKSQPNP